MPHIPACARPLPADRRHLVEENIPLALFAANKFRLWAERIGMAWEDLAQEATIGLMLAAQQHDPDRGQFGAFAYCRIAWRLRTILKRRRWKALPQFPVQLDDKGNLMSEADWIAAPEETTPVAELRDDLERLEWALRLIPSRQRSLLRRYFGIDEDEGCSMRDLAWEAGISQPRVQQLIAKGLHRLRKLLRVAVHDADPAGEEDDASLSPLSEADAGEEAPSEEPALASV